MTVRRRIAPIILAAIVCIFIGCLASAALNTTPDIAVVDSPYSIEGN